MKKMKRYLVLAAVILLLPGCKTGEQRTAEHMDKVLQELRNSPEYLDLSQYEAPEEDRNAMITPAKREPEENDDGLVHFRYSQPVNGYTVTIDWQPGTERAELHFTKGDTSFSVMSYSFDPQMFDFPTEGTDIRLHYKPKPQGRMLYDKEPFSFADVDFDGVEELLITCLLEGPRGMTAYTVYEPDGTEREDAPFWDISDLTDFKASEKAIVQNQYWGALIGGTRLKYRRQQNGTFALTDSTFIEYTIRGDEMVDSIRVHYRRQGGKMVLVRKEVVR